VLVGELETARRELVPGCRGLCMGMVVRRLLRAEAKVADRWYKMLARKDHAGDHSMGHRQEMAQTAMVAGGQTHYRLLQMVRCLQAGSLLAPDDPEASHADSMAVPILQKAAWQRFALTALPRPEVVPSDTQMLDSIWTTLATVEEHVY
jgi:hypothetical protein